MSSEPVTADDLAKLAQPQRVAVVKAFLEKRIDKVANIEVTSESILSSRRWLNGKMGELDPGVSKQLFHTLTKTALTG
jgi:hypothetical protein